MGDITSSNFRMEIVNNIIMLQCQELIRLPCLVHQKVSSIMFHFLHLGSAQPIQLLQNLVYAAAKSGAQQFLKTIFTSSTGRVIFYGYKDCSPLPEVIARKYGHEETAHYLEYITERYTYM